MAKQGPRKKLPKEIAVINAGGGTKVSGTKVSGQEPFGAQAAIRFLTRMARELCKWFEGKPIWTKKASLVM